MSHIVVVKSSPIVDILKQNLKNSLHSGFWTIIAFHQQIIRMYHIASLNILGLSVFLLKNIPHRVFFRSDEMVFLFMMLFIECGCMTLQCFWAVPWIDGVTDPLGWQSPQCSWPNFTWFPSPTKLTKICYLIARILHWQKFGCDHIQRPLQQVQDKISPSSWVSWNHALANPMDVPASNRGFQKLCLFWYKTPSIRASNHLLPEWARM